MESKQISVVNWGHMFKEMKCNERKLNTPFIKVMILIVLHLIKQIVGTYMKRTLNIFRGLNSLSFEKRLIYFFTLVIIVLPVYMVISTYIWEEKESPQAKEIQRISLRLDKLESFLEIGTPGSLSVGYGHLGDNIYDRIKENIEAEIEKIKEEINDLQRDSHYHY